MTTPEYTTPAAALARALTLQVALRRNGLTAMAKTVFDPDGFENTNCYISTHQYMLTDAARQCATLGSHRE